MNTPLIAIVDDDESVRVATTSLVRSFGYEVQTFGSAEDFLTSQERQGASCLISDVQMPGLNGLELQEALASDTSPPPIIFITAYPNADVRQRALEAGAVCFLSKPFDGGTLKQCLDRVFEAQGGP